MKKQLLSIAIVTMLLVATLVSNVSAATLKAANNEGKVTVTVELTNAVEGTDFTLKYDSSKFELDTSYGTGDGKGATANEGTVVVNAKESNQVTVGVFTTSASVTKIEVHFKVKAGATGNGKFEVVGGKLGSTEETVEQPTINVQVAKEEKPSGKPSASGKPSPSGSPSASGKPSGTLAQTGAPLYVIGIAAVVVAAFVLMVKKANK